jgi:hypothetical protein
MPITLNNSNISIQYNTGSNYIIETVKSDLYVRDTVGTTSNLFAEPTVSPSIRTDIVVESFTYTTGTTQTTYTKVFSENTLCDILIVGGGGGGGKTDAGGGGAGGLIYIQNITLTGTYTIAVGKGGLGGTGSGSIGVVGGKGGNTSITGTNANYVAYGGGGGGYGHPSKVEPSNLGPYGSSGGLGSGDQTRESFNVNTIGQGYLGGLGVASGEGGGGGGGSGGAGVTGGNGGVGTQVNITGTNLYYAGGGGGGFNPSGTSGGLGGGGSATYNVGNNATFYGGGGGGGGGNYGNGGNGFDGIVIIRYRSLATAPTSVNMVKTLNFNYYSSLSPTIYTLNFPTRTLATINNSGNKLLNGSYTITLGNTLSTIVVPTTANQNLQDTNYSSSNISVSYHLLNPILDTIGAQWTYSSSNTNVYHLGSVGIETTSPEYTLDVRGTIYSSIGGYTGSTLTTWSITSDRRIKENIVKASYEKCLENVNKIELYNFNFKDNCVNTNDKHQLGFIAQEVREVYPKAVEVNKMILNTNETINDILTLNTTQIDYTLYGAVKNLIEKIDNIDIGLENLGSNITYNKDLIRNTSNIFSIITSNISITTSNIFIGTSNISITTSNISIKTSNIFIRPSKIPIETSNIPIETSNIPN